MERKYYEAYDDRYRQVHRHNLRWFAKAPSNIVSQIITDYGVTTTSKILEIGCGEGRDAHYLLEKGFNLLATDVSSEAIAFCRMYNRSFQERFQVLDCLEQRFKDTFDFIYAVAVVHMLVHDEDRRGFYRFIKDSLADNGIALICSMGDGIIERSSAAADAFKLQERIHEETGKTLHVANTSFRAVSFASFTREIIGEDLVILEQGITEVLPDYGKMMYAVVKKH